MKSPADQVRRATVVIVGCMLLGLAVGSLILCGPVVVAAPNGQPKEHGYPKPPNDKLKLVGAATCQACHGLNDPSSMPEFQSTRGFEYVRLTESKVWARHDSHSTAYKKLLTNRTTQNKMDSPNPIAQQIEDRLRKVRPANYTVAADRACLSCHASTKEPLEQVPPQKWTAEAFSNREGVSCETCHGHGSNYLSRHQESIAAAAGAPAGARRVVPWRTFPPEVKREWGLLNLRDPVVAATTCVSCHVGNVAEGKLLTHDLYAAGHPPLPPFELITFTAGMPRHWGLPTELPYFVSVPEEQRWRQFHFHPVKDEAYATRRLAVSAVVALRAEAELLLAAAREVAKGAQEEIDLSRFDCYGCHHQRNPGDRKKRWQTEVPGTPLKASVLIPAALVARHAVGSEAAKLKELAREFERKETALRKAAVARWRGDPEQMRVAAGEMIAWCDAFLRAQNEYSKPLYTPEQAKRLREMIGAEARGDSGLHPETAIWLAWAYMALAREAKVELPPGARKRLAEAIPLAVREFPDFSEQGPQPEPDLTFSRHLSELLVKPRTRPAPWMNTIKGFEADKFADAFRELAGK